MNDNMNKALADALAYGTGVMHKSDYVVYGDVHLAPHEVVIEAQAAEIERLREALLDALSHCYNCSGDPHYIEEDEVTGDHIWTDCPICRSARAALGETK